MGYTNLKNGLIDFGYVTLGVLTCGFALKGFLIPNKFLDGGLTGIMLLIHELYHFNIAALIIIVNFPFIIMSGLQVSERFAIKTFLAVILFALCLHFIDYPEITSDKLLVSIFGGAFMGIGIGLAIRGGCALDGIEVLALYTVKKISFTISEIILGLNIIIFLIAAVQLGLPIALYSILTYYVASKVSTFIVEGVEEYTGVTIVSSKSSKIKEKLVLDLNRGVTVYKGKKGFLKDSFTVSSEVDILFTVVTRLDLIRLNKAVYQIDPDAFVFTAVIKDAKGGVLKPRPH